MVPDDFWAERLEQIHADAPLFLRAAESDRARGYIAWVSSSLGNWPAKQVFRWRLRGLFAAFSRQRMFANHALVDFMVGRCNAGCFEVLIGDVPATHVTPVRLSGENVYPFRDRMMG
jgi:hypothetical protein